MTNLDYKNLHTLLCCTSIMAGPNSNENTKQQKRQIRKLHIFLVFVFVFVLCFCFSFLKFSLECKNYEFARKVSD